MATTKEKPVSAKDFLAKNINDDALISAHKRLELVADAGAKTADISVLFLRKRNASPWRRETIAKSVPVASLAHVLLALKHYMIEEMRQISKDERIADPDPVWLRRKTGRDRDHLLPADDATMPSAAIVAL